MQFSLQETLGNLWEHFCSRLGCYWHLVGGGPDAAQHPHGQDVPITVLFWSSVPNSSVSLPVSVYSHIPSFPPWVPGLALGRVRDVHVASPTFWGSLSNWGRCSKNSALWIKNVPHTIWRTLSLRPRFAGLNLRGGSQQSCQDRIWFYSSLALQKKHSLFIAPI